jgi:two-component system alkaline phosphatase synthesis response regulator PhoP/two-component system response regulator ResD
MTLAEPTTDVVLVADDDEHTVELVSLYLRRAGYRVETACDGEETLRKARESLPALIVLDIMMPGPDGLQICRKLRGQMPILLLTARASDIDRIAGLRLGADDYVTKPFNPDELVARVAAVLRRAGPTAAARTERVRVGSLSMDIDCREARIGDASISLTPREFDLLLAFAHFPNVVLDRDRLLDLAWGTSFYGHRTVDVHVARLREKLADRGVHIETVWGTGYRLVQEN